MLKKFLIIGGMPEVVRNFVTKNDLRECQRVLDDLIISFRNDFAKYRVKIPSLRIREVFESVCNRLGENMFMQKLRKI